jgi:fructose-specific phosphotransferase system component IIB
VEDSLLKLAVQREKTQKSPNQTNSKTGKRKLFHQKKLSQQEVEKALLIILNKWTRIKKRKNKKIQVKKFLKKELKPLKNIVFRWKKRKKRKKIQNNLDE